MPEIKCIGDEGACSSWASLVGDYLHKLGNVVKGVPSKVLLLVTGGGNVIVNDSSSGLVTCDYDAVIPRG